MAPGGDSKTRLGVQLLMSMALGVGLDQVQVCQCPFSMKKGMLTWKAAGDACPHNPVLYKGVSLPEGSEAQATKTQWLGDVTNIFAKTHFRWHQQKSGREKRDAIKCAKKQQGDETSAKVTKWVCVNSTARMLCSRLFVKFWFAGHEVGGSPGALLVTIVVTCCMRF